MNFLKKFGIGLLYCFLFPFIIAAALVQGVIGLFNFLIQFVVMVVNFFKGKKLFPYFKEDVKAIEIQKINYNKAMNNRNAQQNPANTFIQQNFYGNPQTQIPPQYQGIPANPNYQQIPPQYQNQQIEAPQSVEVGSEDKEWNN